MIHGGKCHTVAGHKCVCVCELSMSGGSPTVKGARVCESTQTVNTAVSVSLLSTSRNFQTWFLRFIGLVRFDWKSNKLSRF